ncbi:MAG: outer membrane beta-barrel protein [Desulfatiglandaceae bacterium]
MRIGTSLSLFVALSLLLFSSTESIAELGRIHTGNLKVFPSLELQFIWDDNIFLSSGDNRTTEKEESDLITLLKPAVLLDYSLGPRGGVQLGYQGDLAYYRDNDDNDWQTHRGLFNLDYFAPGGLILGINNVYTDAEDPFGSVDQFNLGIKTERWNNDFKTRVGYAFSNKSRILGYYNFYKQDYERREDFTQDYYVSEVGAGFEKRLSPKTWGFIRSHYGIQNYYSSEPAFNVTGSTDADNDWLRVNTGLAWDMGGKLGGELNLGYQWREFENKRDARGNEYKDKDLWIAATSIAYELSVTTRLALNLSRSLRTTGAQSNEYFVDTAVEVNLRQMLLPKLTLAVGGLYSKNDYNEPPGDSREDDNYRANIDLYYQIQEWLGARIGYNYMKKDSNVEEFDYTDNQFMVSVGVAY